MVVICTVFLFNHITSMMFTWQREPAGLDHGTNILAHPPTTLTTSALWNSVSNNIQDNSFKYLLHLICLNFGEWYCKPVVINPYVNYCPLVTACCRDPHCLTWCPALRLEAGNFWLAAHVSADCVLRAGSLYSMVPTPYRKAYCGCHSTEQGQTTRRLVHSLENWTTEEIEWPWSVWKALTPVPSRKIICYMYIVLCRASDDLLSWNSSVNNADKLTLELIL